MMRVVWRYAAHQKVHAAVYSHDTACAAVAMSRLIAVRTDTGAERWRARVPNTWGWIAAANDTVFYLAQHSTLAAFDIQSGHRRWTRELRGTFGSLHATRRSVVVGGWRGYTDVESLSPSTGETLWTFPTRGKDIRRTAILGEGEHLLLFDADDGCVRQIALSSGEVSETVSLEPQWVPTPIYGVPGSSSGSWYGLPDAMYLTRGTEELTRIQADPLRLSTLELPEQPASICPSVADWFAFVGASRHLWFRSSAADAWLDCGPIAHFNRMTPLPAVRLPDSRLVVGTSEGLLYAFDTEDGRMLERQRIGKRVTEALALSSETLCLATYSGDIVGVDA